MFYNSPRFKIIYVIACLSFLLVFTNPYNGNAKKQEIPTTPTYYVLALSYELQGDLENAVLFLNNALSINPNDELCLVKLGEVLLNLKKPDLAISPLLMASKIAPEDALTHFLLGIAYKENKQLKEAENEFRQAIKLEPNNILIRSNIGIACLLKNNNKCAIENLGKVALSYPNELRSKAALAIAYQSDKNYANAKEHYKFLLGYINDNFSFSIWHNYGKTQIALGEYEEALDSLSKAISIITKNDPAADVYLDRASIYYKLNKLEEAEDDYKRALNLDPVNPSIPIEYANFLSNTGAYLKAVNQYNAALELQAGDINLLENKAYLLQLANEDEEAIKTWNEVLNTDKNNETAFFNLARLYEKKENYTSAIDYYNKFLQIKSDDNEVQAALASCLLKNKDFIKAKEIYQTLLSKNPSDPNTLFNLGQILIEEKSYKEASEYLEQAIQNHYLDKDKKKAYSTLIKALTNLNDNVKLKSTYNNWLEIEKDNIEARLSYADFLEKTNDIQAATDQYRIAAALDKTSKTRLKLAKFLLQHKDLYGAVGELQEYLKTEANDLDALILLGDAFKDLDLKEQAIVTYKKIISIQYDNHLAYYNLGLLYEQENQHENAQNSLLKAIELNDKYAPAYYALALSYMADEAKNEQEKNKKAIEFLQKYLQLDPTGEYKDKADAKLKELNT